MNVKVEAVLYLAKVLAIVVIVEGLIFYFFPWWTLLVIIAALMLYGLYRFVLIGQEAERRIKQRQNQ